MNKDWHNKNPFPEDASEEVKAKWREIHKQHCTCGSMLLPYRRKSR